MKKLLILAYVIAVLLLSGMVKADQIGLALVESATINPSGIVSVNSLMPTPCNQLPRIMISKINETDKALELQVLTQIQNKTCSDYIVNTPKKVIFDLKQLPLRIGEIYSVTFVNYIGEKIPLKYKVLPNDLNLNLDFQKNEVKGTLVNYKKIDGGPIATFALQKGNDTLPVATTDMTPELSQLVGGEVHITGYVLNAATLLESKNELAPSSQISSVIVPVSVSQ